MAAGAQENKRGASREGKGIGVLVCESYVGPRRTGRHRLEHFRLAAFAHLGIPPTRDGLMGGGLFDTGMGLSWLLGLNQAWR